MKSFFKAVAFATFTFLTGCTVVPLEPPPTRMLEVEITTKNEGIGAYISTSTLQNKRFLGKLPLKTSVPINDGGYRITFDGFSTVDSFISPKGFIDVSYGQSIVKENIEVVSYASVLAKEFKSFKKPTRLQIVKVISSFEVVAKTARGGYESSLAAAKGELSILKVDDEAFQNSAFVKKLDSMAYNLKAAPFLGYIDPEFHQDMRLIKSVLGI